MADKDYEKLLSDKEFLEYVIGNMMDIYNDLQNGENTQNIMEGIQLNIEQALQPKLEEIYKAIAEAEKAKKKEEKEQSSQSPEGKPWELKPEDLAKVKKGHAKIVAKVASSKDTQTKNELSDHVID